MSLALKDCDVRSWTHTDAEAIVRHAKAVGNIALVTREEPTAAEPVCRLGEAHWQHGIATQAARAVNGVGVGRARPVANLRARLRVERGVRPRAGESRLHPGTRATHPHLKDGKLVDRLVYAAVRLP